MQLPLRLLHAARRLRPRPRLPAAGGAARPSRRSRGWWRSSPGSASRRCGLPAGSRSSAASCPRWSRAGGDPGRRRPDPHHQRRAPRRAGRRARRLPDCDRVTISLDADDDATFMRMNDAGVPVSRVLAGIEAAEAAGLGPIKLNMVVKRGWNEHAILPMARRFRGTGRILRFIEYMDVGPLERLAPGRGGDRRRDPRNDCARSFPWSRWRPRSRGEVAERYRYADGGGEIGDHRLGQPPVLRRLQPRPPLRRRAALHLPLRHRRPRPARAGARRRDRRRARGGAACRSGRRATTATPRSDPPRPWRCPRWR